MQIWASPRIPLTSLALFVAFTGCTLQRTEPAKAGSGGTNTVSQADVERRTRAHTLYAESLLDRSVGPAQSLDKLDQAFRLDPGDEWLALELSRRYILLTNYDKALETLKLAAAQPGPSARIFSRIGSIHFEQGQTNLALLANEDAIKADPRALIGYQNLYIINLATRSNAQALAALDRAAAVTRTSAPFLLDLAELYTTFIRREPAQTNATRARALRTLDRAAKLHPTEDLLVLQMADGYYMLNELDRARTLYEQLAGRATAEVLRDNVDAKLVEIDLLSNQRERAIERLKARVADDPSDVDAYSLLSAIAAKAKKYGEAADYLKKALLFRPELEVGYYELAALQIEGDEARAALDTLDRARTRFGQNIRMEELMGHAYTRLKDFTEAARHYATAETMLRVTDPDQLREFYFRLGATAERAGNYQGSEKYFLRCLELSPEFAAALNYLGYMWADRGENLDRARDMIERAVKQEPESAAYLDSLGWVLFKQGKTAEALPWLQKAEANSEAPDPEIMNHLGEVYRELGQTSKAIEAYKKSLSAEPNDVVRKKLEALGGR